MTKNQERRICREYYLDCRQIEKIAHDLGVSKKAVRAVIDDPATQTEYLLQAERTRKRTRARAANAADLALEKQVEFLRRDVGDELLPTQQTTARALLGFGLKDAEDRNEIRITFAGGEIKLGMPKEMHGDCDAE